MGDRIKWWLLKRWGVCDHTNATEGPGYAYVWRRCPDCGLIKSVGITEHGAFVP